MDVWMETQTGEMEASRVLWAEWGQAWCGMVGRRGGGERGEWPPLETSRSPLNWRCGSPACCVLRAAAAAVCGVTDGRAGASSLAVRGKIFRNGGRQDTHHHRQFPPVGFPLAAPLSMAPGPELVSVSLPPDCGGCLGDWPFHQGSGDAGSIQHGEETLASSHFPRMRMPLRRRNLTRNGPGRESPARVERERRIRPTSFLSQVCLWQD